MSRRPGDFTERTISTLAKRVGYCCSNPRCAKPTSGPNSDPEKATVIGEAAHITAASPGGPRYDPDLTSDERKSIVNGIWLCSDCAKFIDREEAFVSVSMLREWKRISESGTSKQVLHINLPRNLAISRVLQNEYVQLDIDLAFDVILDTQKLGDELKNFILQGPAAIRRITFSELKLQEVREFVLRDIERDMRFRDRDRITLEDLKKSFDRARVYGQRYDCVVPETVGRAFIFRTPTQEDFDRAQEAVLSVIRHFDQRMKGGDGGESPSSADARMTIRGTERFFDIEVGGEINKEAWVGFDFRA